MVFVCCSLSLDFSHIVINDSLQSPFNVNILLRDIFWRYLCIFNENLIILLSSVYFDFIADFYGVYIP